MNPSESKTALRRKNRGVLMNLPPEQRAADSAKICALLIRQPFWQNAASVLFFAPLPGEVDMWPLLEETAPGAKTAALPRFDLTDQTYVACRVQNPQSEIAIGQFGIREPRAGCVEVALSRLDLILVPGVAFDSSGRRLGRGRGFYDRLLAEMSGLKCGVAFDEQIVGEVPAGAHDETMNFILTPTRCVRCEG